MNGIGRSGSAERYGQLVPLVAGPRRPTAAEYAPYFAENRDRARAAYERADVLSPEGAERVWTPRSVQSLIDRLGDEDLAVWVEGDVIHVVWRGEQSGPVLGGGLQGLPLWPIGDTPLWEISLRIEDADRALVSVTIMSGEATTFTALARSVYRGLMRDALDATGRHSVTHYERVNGHDWLFWAEELSSAIATIYDTRDDDAPRMPCVRRCRQ